MPNNRPAYRLQSKPCIVVPTASMPGVSVVSTYFCLSREVLTVDCVACIHDVVVFYVFFFRVGCEDLARVALCCVLRLLSGCL